VSTHPTWQGKRAVLPADRGIVYFDGIFTEPQLNHPEGLVFDRQGNLICGGEKGEIFRIDAKGRSIELLASTGGFTLGLAIDKSGRIYSCDLKHGAVFRFDPADGSLNRLAEGFSNPNYPVIDPEDRYMYVSDSRNPGPGIWRLSLADGTKELWYDRPLVFANGMALAEDEGGLYVAETFAKRISFIPILADGRAGERRTVVELGALPDGLARSGRGVLYISCYEPSMIYRWSETAGLELLYYDPEAHTLCHPTNCALRDGDLYTANLGRWHITRILDVE
jgi:sugar lactone lactonase YvrE